jgi:hypothetical protein
MKLPSQPLKSYFTRNAALQQSVIFDISQTDCVDWKLRLEIFQRRFYLAFVRCTKFAHQRPTRRKESFVRATYFPFSEHSFLGGCVKLAQSTFFDLLPSNLEGRGPTAPAIMPAPKRNPPPEAQPNGWLAAIGDWFYAQSVKEREAYLAQSTDIFDLEERMRRYDRQACH